jgi:hypothetical protein
MTAQWTTKLNQLLDKLEPLISSSSLVYSDITIGGTASETYAQTCSKWNQFYSRAASAGISKQLVQLTLAYTLSLNTTSSFSKTVSCTRSNTLSNLQAATVNGSIVSVSCGSGDWSAGRCFGNFAFCVNCTQAYSTINLVNSFSPCATNSSGNNCLLQPSSIIYRHSSFARVLIATFEAVVPSIGVVSVVSVSKYAVTLSVELDQFGAAYCAAYTLTRTPTATQQIVSVGQNAWGTNNVVVNVTSLESSTDYYVYCVAMSAQGQLSDIAATLENRVQITTSCCRSVVFGLITKSVYADTSDAKLATIKVRQLPTTDLIVLLSTVHSNNTGTYTATALFPSSFKLASATARHFTVAFVGTSYSGTFNISVSLQGSDASNYEVVYSNGFQLQVLDRTATPAPALLSAQFSSDGYSLGIMFDSPTDKGQVSSINDFVCSQLFVFAGAAAARCRWSADAMSVAVAPSPYHPLLVGSQVSVVSNKIRAECPRTFIYSICAAWTTVNSSKILAIKSPPSPTSPKVRLTVPATIGSCDSLLLDFGSSTGSGGRAWKSLNISLTSTTASNITGITSFLAKSSTTVVSQLTIPGGFLSKGHQYIFTVSLCNFLGARGSSSGSVNVLNIVDVPTVSVIGGPFFSALANSSVTLSSSAYTASCDGSRSALNLQYVWTTFLLNGSRITSSQRVTSVSKDASKYSISAYQLTPQSSYSVVVTVTDLVTLKSSSDTVYLTVPVSDLIVLIAGGIQQSVRVNHSFIIDASSSYDSDQVNNGRTGIYFSWTCIMTSPTNSLYCPLTLGYTNSSALVGFANVSSGNSSSQFGLSIYDSTRVASASIVVTVLAEIAPLVNIVTVQANRVQSSSILILKGWVSILSSAILAGASLECVWSVDDPSIDLSVASYVPSTQIIPFTAKADSASIYLSLSPNTLPVDASFVFALTCALLDSASGSSGAASFASFLVSTNSPPVPGIYAVDPLSGIELLTTFQITAKYWVDSDIPISYEFGFMSSAMNISFVVQTKGLGSTASTNLAAGSALLNYSLTTIVQVFDSLDASAIKYASVRVMSAALNSTSLNTKTTAFLNEVGSNVDGLKQIISVVASALSSVNCSLAPNCTSLNRFGCGSTPQTCGTCLSDEYVGNPGDSNSKCLAATEFHSFLATANGTCESSNDCSPWATCNTETSKCLVSSKVCAANCTSPQYGECIFVHVNSLEGVASCAVDDPQCDAICICNTGFYGDDCSFSEIDLMINQNTVTQLMSSLQTVNSLETLDTQSAVFWSNSLQALTANKYLLTDVAAAIAYNISLTMLQEIASLSPPSVTMTLAAVVDNIVGSSYLSSSAVSSGRRLSANSAANSSAIQVLLDSVSSSIIDAMVPAQDSQTISRSNYRLVAKIFSDTTTSSNYSLNAPQTTLEAVSNFSFSSVELSNLARVFEDVRSVVVGVGLVSVPQYLLNLDSYRNLSTGSNISVTSNAFRVNLRSESSFINSSCSGAHTVFSFVHYATESFGLTANGTGGITSVARTTSCENGVNRTVSIWCPVYGQEISVYCNGSLPSHSIVTRCPQQKRLPVCAMTSVKAEPVRCDLVSYTETTTTCRCSSCLFMDLEENRRRLTTSSASSYGTEILALSEYSFIEYASVMESAANFNSLSAVKGTLLIIIAFGFMWLGMILLMCTLEFSRRVPKAYKPFNSRMLRSVVPQRVNDPHAAGDSIKDNRRKAPVNSVSQESLRYTSLEECLKDYIQELFSPAFSEDSEPVRFMRELWNKHEYISVFTRKEFGTEQWIEVFCLLTNLSANFFLLALFYDIQFASDDGSCSLLKTEAGCLAKRTMFNPSQSKCLWVASAEQSTCMWQEPKFELITTIVIFVIVLAVSSPITFSISCLCEMVLMAPSLSEVAAQDYNKRARRRSAVAMMNAKNMNIIAAPEPVDGGSLRKSKRSSSAHGKSSHTHNISVFSTVEEMGDSIKKASSEAHRLSGQQFTVVDRKRNAKHQITAPDIDYKSFACFAGELKNFAELLQQQRQLRGQRATVLEDKCFTYSAKIPFDEFKLVWGAFLGNNFFRINRRETDIEIGSKSIGRDNDFDSYSVENSKANMNHSHTATATAPIGKNDQNDGHALETARNEADGNIGDEADDSDSSSDSGADSHRNRDDNFDTVEAHSAGSTELEKVFKEAHSWIKRLKHDTPEHIGVQILELFVRDCLGQNSRQAVIFSQKIRPVEMKVVMPWSVKCLTFLGLCILNIYFVFSCMLYGKDRGLTWQRGWLFTCIVNIFVDVFVNATCTAAIMHFFVPNLIVDEALSIKQIVTNIVHDFCSVSSMNIRSMRDMAVSNPVLKPACTFCATDYFFVSAHVARSFPDLLESKIVLAYKSLFLSQSQMDAVNPNLRRRQLQTELEAARKYWKHRRTRTNTRFLDRAAWRYRWARRVVASISVWATTLLLVFGSQSLLGQQFIITMFNPGLVAAIAYFGLAIWRNSFFGMLVAVVVVLVGFSFLYWAIRRLLNRSSKVQDWLSQSGADGAAQQE